MSVWTHVAAVFRIDDVRTDGRMPCKGEWDRMVGKEIFEPASYLDCDDYERQLMKDDWDEYNRHPSRFLPTGSEGSLRRLIWANPNRDSATAYTVTVFGDLRSYDDWQAVRRWFEEVCDRTHARQAVCMCDVEGSVMTWTRRL